MTQDTFSGAGEYESVLVSELLAELGVAQAALNDQRAAVQRWLDNGNTPSRMLALALRARALPSTLSMEGEDFARALGFDDIGNEIADIKANRSGEPPAARAVVQLDGSGFVVSDPQILGGHPVIRGTRLLVHSVKRRIDAGDTFEMLERERPDVAREAFRAAYDYANTHPEPPRAPMRWR